MEVKDEVERRLHGWAILVSVGLIAFPVLFAVTAAIERLHVVHPITSGPGVAGLIGRSGLLLLLATPVYFLLAASASYGFRIGKVERWVVWSHWLVVAAVFQGEAWRLMAWTFFRETAHSFGPMFSLRLAAALAQALPYLLFWGAILHILILEIEAGSTGDIRDDPFARRRFWQLVWGLWPAAMTGLVALDLFPGVWRAHPAYADVGPLGIWLLGVAPFRPLVGHGSRLALAVANGAAEVWVLAAIAVLLIVLRIFLVRYFLAASPSPHLQSNAASSGAAPPDRPGNGNPPGVSESTRKADPKPFLVQFVTLNGGLLLLIIAPSYVLISSLFHLGAIPTPAVIERVFSSLGKAFSVAFLSSRLVAPVVAAFAVGAIGWVVSMSAGKDEAAVAAIPPQDETRPDASSGPVGLSPATSLLLAMLAFWPLGWGMAAGMASEPYKLQPTLFLARWVPNGLVVVPFLLLTLRPHRRNWWVPMIVAAATAAWIGLNPPVLNSLVSFNCLEDVILSPNRTFVSGMMGWPGTGMAATVLMVVSFVLIGVSWTLAIVLWPRRGRNR